MLAEMDTGSDPYDSTPCSSAVGMLCWVLEQGGSTTYDPCSCLKQGLRRLTLQCRSLSSGNFQRLRGDDLSPISECGFSPVRVGKHHAGA